MCRRTVGARLDDLAVPHGRPGPRVERVEPERVRRTCRRPTCRRRRGRCGSASSPFALIALVTKMRPPHTIGLESESPGSGVLKRTFVPFATSQVAGTPWPSPTPDGLRPAELRPRPRGLARCGRVESGCRRLLERRRVGGREAEARDLPGAVHREALDRARSSPEAHVHVAGRALEAALGDRRDHQLGRAFRRDHETVAPYRDRRHRPLAPAEASGVLRQIVRRDRERGALRRRRLRRREQRLEIRVLLLRRVRGHARRRQLERLHPSRSRAPHAPARDRRPARPRRAPRPRRPLPSTAVRPRPRGGWLRQARRRAMPRAVSVRRTSRARSRRLRARPADG